jgi:hypothetical protein
MSAASAKRVALVTGEWTSDDFTALERMRWEAMRASVWDSICAVDHQMVTHLL